MQELLQKLLKAESVVEEREREEHLIMKVIPEETMVESTRTPRTITRREIDPVKSVNAQLELRVGSTEMGLQSVKCFKCSKLGHVAKDCPEKRQNKSTRRIALSEE